MAEGNCKHSQQFLLLRDCAARPCADRQDAGSALTLTALALGRNYSPRVIRTHRPIPSRSAVGRNDPFQSASTNAIQGSSSRTRPTAQDAPFSPRRAPVPNRPQAPAMLERKSLSCCASPYSLRSSTISPSACAPNCSARPDNRPFSGADHAVCALFPPGTGTPKLCRIRCGGGNEDTYWENHVADPRGRQEAGSTLHRAFHTSPLRDKKLSRPNRPKEKELLIPCGPRAKVGVALFRQKLFKNSSLGIRPTTFEPEIAREVALESSYDCRGRAKA